jgi:hypothetical protein
MVEKKLKFKDFLAVDYVPGMPDLIKKNAKKRKMDAGTGTNAEYASTVSPEENKETTTIDEALNMQQRLKKSRTMKKFQARLKVGRKKAAAKMANAQVLMKRSRKAARNAIVKKITKGIPKGDLTPARKMEIEKRLEKMQPRISRLAKKLLPKLRKAELSRKRG